VDKSSPGFQINDDISRAETLPADVYVDLAWYERAREKISARSWQFIGEAAQMKAPGHVRPFTLLEGCLDEPLLLTVDENVQTHCLSNVCTHRGAIVLEGEGHLKGMRCRYHGRKFALDGSFSSMPEFDGVANFPSEKDNLRTSRSNVGDRFYFAISIQRSRSMNGSSR
jgi:choline monooxygenase